MDEEKINMKEIARRAGVSVMTVSRVMAQRGSFSQKTRAKIEKIASSLGYFPNRLGRSLVLNRLDTIGVVVPNIIHSFFPSVVNSIEETLAPLGLSTLLCCSHDSPEIEAEKVRTLLGYRVAGIILLPSMRSPMSAETAKMIVERKCPLLLVDRILKKVPADTIGWRSEEAMEEIVCHLSAQGCKRLVYLAGEEQEWRERGRTKGFLKALAKRGQKPFAELYCKSASDVFEELSRLLSAPDRPDAVCCATDFLADEALLSLKRLNISVPKDTALTSFGGTINSHNSKIRITTAVLDADAMGRKAAEMIAERINSKVPKKFKNIRLPLPVEIEESSIRK